MSTGTFDLWQQTFTMSLMANGDSGLKGDTPEQLQQALQQSITSKLGNSGLQGLVGSGWTIGWGPYVYQAPSDKSGEEDNAMWVARNTDTDTYVVAVAATNFVSFFDWISEDGKIQPEVAWPYKGTVPSGATISPGTQLGVDNLLAMPSQGQTGPSLLSYLQGAQSPSATLIFTGHSLGGALSPTLAAALFADPQNGLSIDSWKAVSVYPTAGPTPGNSGFKQLFSRMFPQQSPGSAPWQAWNLLVWNGLDIVPHAWNLSTLNEISSLYMPEYPPGPLLSVALSSVIGRAAGTDYVQLPSNGPLAGTLVKPSGELEVLQFLNEALYQHVTAYLYLLQIEKLLDLRDASGNPLFHPPTPFSQLPRSLEAAA